MEFINICYFSIFEMFHRYMKENGRVGQYTIVRLLHLYHAHVPFLKWYWLFHLHWVPLCGELWYQIKLQ